MEGHNSVCGPHRCEVCGKAVACSGVAQHVEPSGCYRQDIVPPPGATICHECSRTVGWRFDEALRDIAGADCVRGQESPEQVARAVVAALAAAKGKVTDHERQTEFEESPLFLEWCLAHPVLALDEERYVPALRAEVFRLRREIQVIQCKAAGAAPQGVRTEER